jgi:hypothetical protein
MVVRRRPDWMPVFLAMRVCGTTRSYESSRSVCRERLSKGDPPDQISPFCTNTRAARHQAMKSINCNSCGQVVHYLEESRGILSCPNCGEQLADFGKNSPLFHSATKSTNQPATPHRTLFIPHFLRHFLGYGLISLGLCCFVVGGMIGFGILGQFGPADNLSLRNVIMLFICGAGATIIRMGRKLTVKRASDIVGKDRRAPVLLLRSFSDDEIVIEHIGKGSTFFPQPITLEEAIVPVLSLLGPVVAIGRPGEFMTPLGAAREYVSHETWKNEVQQWLHRASLVVMIMGPLAEKEGLAWELSQIRSLEGLKKLMLVMPPVNTLKAAQRWEQFRVFLGIDRLPYDGGELYVTFFSNGSPRIERVDRDLARGSMWSAEAYRAALTRLTDELRV